MHSHTDASAMAWVRISWVGVNGTDSRMVQVGALGGRVSLGGNPWGHALTGDSRIQSFPLFLCSLAYNVSSFLH